MMRRKPGWYREPPEEELGRIVAALNTPSARWAYPVGHAMDALGLGTLHSSKGVGPLRHCVEAWQNSGPDLRKFAKLHPELWAYVRQPWSGLGDKPFLIATDSGMAEVVWPCAQSPSSEQEALKYFVSLITNPLWARLGGPCARCGKYYVRRTAHDPKVYCSRSCGTKNSAIAATKKARAKEHAEKLQRAQKSIEQWRSTGTKLDWKEWVSRRGDITSKFLTRAVNRGELTTPIRSSSKEK